MTYKTTTLPNGLRIASETLPGVESVTVAISVGVGSRYEDEKENGISHLLEHMAFKGTKKRTAQDIAEAFDSIGGKSNAYTSTESTVYYAKVLKDDVRIATDILCDIVQNSTIDAEELKREQEVVLEEIAMQNDTPEDLINDYFDATAFPDQPLGRSILSTPEQVASYSQKDIVRFMDLHYRPPRIVLTAAGNIHHDMLEGMAEEFMRQKKQDAGPTFPPAKYVGGDRRVTGDFEQLHLMVGLPAVSIYSPDFYSMQLYASVLGGGMSSRLFQEVREKRGLAYTVFASATSYEDEGVMSIYAACAPKKAKELSGVLMDQIMGMTKGISQAELERAKNQYKAEILMGREKSQTVAADIGRQLLMFGEYKQAKKVAALIDSVTTADIKRVSKELIKGALTVCALGKVSGILPYDEMAKKLT